uniref:Uncharacterized protein n=1 Tax=Chromera velia CCMP2878 TaxID=1169474 RepID=A0A0G4I9U8_9ALVE|eukprot:Cvel_12382.t1-p1 / transcript=Cvel_12382.t1 / gene=Cvel_12382 / organism=Chromera_velia_CCMP2878 / gene_product=hypothetical protein / transcript_product=hypothetical protein / location=Cvel_scaffold808:62919-63131(+) / protein_length=71 / sequence_SO=supercontig / SO=protein_coding / is_pseudo=false
MKSLFDTAKEVFALGEKIERLRHQTLEKSRADFDAVIVEVCRLALTFNHKNFIDMKEIGTQDEAATSHDTA